MSLLREVDKSLFARSRFVGAVREGVPGAVAKGARGYLIEGRHKSSWASMKVYSRSWL